MRTAEAKFALYFDPAGKRPPEYEMYDLDATPTRAATSSTGSTGEALSPGIAALRSELGQRLDRLMAVNGTAPT